MIERIFCNCVRILILLALMWTAGGWPSQAADLQTSQQSAPTSRSSQNEAVPVVVGNKTILYVREGYFSFTPQDRANLVAQRIEALIDDSPARTRAITTVDAETTTSIVSGDTVIMTVTDADGTAVGISRQQLAAQDAQIIRSAVLDFRREHSVRAILIGFLLAALATIALILLLKLMGMLCRKIYATLRSWHGKYIRSIRIQKVELLPAERITNSLILFARGLRLILSLLLFYFYLSLVFSFFP